MVECSRRCVSIWIIKIKNKSEPRHRGMKFGISLHSIDNGVQALPAGGAFGLKSEPRHRGMKFGISLHSIDNWVQALPAAKERPKGA